MSHILSTCAPGSLLSSRIGVPSRLSLWIFEAEQAPHPQQPCSHLCSVHPPLLAVSAGHLQMEFFWNVELVALPDQLAPLLEFVAISGAAEVEVWVGVGICSDDRLPAPPCASDSLSL